MRPTTLGGTVFGYTTRLGNVHVNRYKTCVSCVFLKIHYHELEGSKQQYPGSQQRPILDYDYGNFTLKNMVVREPINQTLHVGWTSRDIWPKNKQKSYATYLTGTPAAHRFGNVWFVSQGLWQPPNPSTHNLTFFRVMESAGCKVDIWGTSFFFPQVLKAAVHWNYA